MCLIQQNDTDAHVEPRWELRWRDGVAEVLRAGGYAHLRAMYDVYQEQFASH